MAWPLHRAASAETMSETFSCAFRRFHSVNGLLYMDAITHMDGVGDLYSPGGTALDVYEELSTRHESGTAVGAYVEWSERPSIDWNARPSIGELYEEFKARYSRSNASSASQPFEHVAAVRRLASRRSLSPKALRAFSISESPAESESDERSLATTPWRCAAWASSDELTPQTRGEPEGAHAPRCAAWGSAPPIMPHAANLAGLTAALERLAAEERSACAAGSVGCRTASAASSHETLVHSASAPSSDETLVLRASAPSSVETLVHSASAPSSEEALLHRVAAASSGLTPSSEEALLHRVAAASSGEALLHRVAAPASKARGDVDFLECELDDGSAFRHSQEYACFKPDLEERVSDVEDEEGLPAILKSPGRPKKDGSRVGCPKWWSFPLPLGDFDAFCVCGRRK
ncbi:hypothetical protein AB1Y20_002511 [Prymnesium parvum]|uniref:Uncharacterized protein n=1 Tax=Prymnesium parvum TaxID=97485 RepID=A0AB34JC17_PRYPA